MIETHLSPENVIFTEDDHITEHFPLTLPHFLTPDLMNNTLVEQLKEQYDYQNYFLSLETSDNLLHVKKIFFPADEFGFYLSVYFVFEQCINNEHYFLNNCSISIIADSENTIGASPERRLYQLKAFWHLFEFLQQNPNIFIEKSVQNFWKQIQQAVHEQPFKSIEFNKTVLEKQLDNLHQIDTFNIFQSFKIDSINTMKIQFMPENNYAQTTVAYQRKNAPFIAQSELLNFCVECNDTDQSIWTLKRARIRTPHTMCECKRHKNHIRATHSATQHILETSCEQGISSLIKYHNYCLTPRIKTMTLVAPLLIQAGVKCRFDFDEQGAFIHTHCVSYPNHYYNNFPNLSFYYQVVMPWIMEAAPDIYSFIRNEVLYQGQIIYELNEEQFMLIMYNFQNVQHWLEEIKKANVLLQQFHNIVEHSQATEQDITEFIINSVQSIAA